MNSNKLTSFPDLRVVSSTLKTLSLGTNEISVVDDNVLDSLVNLEQLDIADNKLISFPNLTYSAGSLLYLFIHDNNTNEINGQLLSLLTYLTYLDLRNNRLTHFSNFHVNGTALMPKLQTLLLSGNRFTSLPDTSEIMAFAPELRTFYLQDNLVRVVPAHLNTTKMAGNLTIYLNGNQIETLPVFNSSSVTLVADSNPIICDNALKQLICGNNMVSVSGTCEKPPRLKGRSLSSLTISDLTGESTL